MERSPRNILVLSLKYLGDVIAATPAFRGLNESFPDAKITVALRTGYEEVLAGNPHINDIIPINRSHRTFFDELKTIAMIRKNKYDMIIAMEPGDRESLWAFFGGAKKRIAPAYQPLEFLWSIRVPIREESISYIEYYNKIAQAAGARISSEKTEIFISAEAVQWADKFLKNIHVDGKTLIGIHPGAREANRRWSPQKFAELIGSLHMHGDNHIVLMCGRGEQRLLDEILSFSGTHPSLSLAPDLSIQQTAALMQRCALCITNDSAPRHIAVAVGSKTVSIISPSKVRAWSLYDPENHPLLVGNGADPQSLVKSVSTEEVYAVIEKMLAKL
ncbi:MAG TPA: glycosyltransferase family 9 protein [Candidatus Kapabacteria bacterium]|nr:glycosyltransferase family 9 protein [Candidatus Kapabacteria bacterium]